MAYLFIAVAIADYPSDRNKDMEGSTCSEYHSIPRRFPLLPSYLFRGASPPVTLNEYVLDADGGTGHVEHADKAKAVSNVMVKKISLLM